MNKQLIIEARLRSDTEFLFKCILKLYEQQTEFEQDIKSTAEQNGVGFTKADAPFLTEVTQQIHKNGGTLSEKHYRQYLPQAAMSMLKYAKQLSNLLTDEEVVG